MRFGLLSTANINRRILEAGVDVVAVASRDESRAHAYAREHGIARAHGSYEALLADDEVDAVYISLPNALHVEWSIKALEAGKHVLCEKPLSRHPDEVERAYDAAERAGRTLLEGFMWRHTPQAAKLRELLPDPIRVVRAHFSFGAREAGDIRLDPALDGGALMDVGCYCVSAARFVCGSEPEVIAATAVWDGVDVAFAGTMRFPGGTLFHFDCAMNAANRSELEIVGADSTILVRDPFHSRDVGIEVDGERVEVEFKDPYLCELEALADPGGGPGSVRTRSARRARSPRCTPPLASVGAVWRLLAIAATLWLVPGVARAGVTLTEGAPTLGYVHLVASADAQILEDEAPVASGADVQLPWTCTTARTFIAVVGDQRSAPLTVTTPSCAKRYRLDVTDRISLGDNIRVTLFDQWHRGSLKGELCATRPDAQRTCAAVDLPASQFIASAVFRARRAGEWTLAFSDGATTALRPVVVQRKRYPRGRPTVLSTGDSIMLTPTTAITRALQGIARVIDDVYVGSGITRPFVVDWAKLPGKQVKAYRPDAVVVSIGMGDGRAIGPVECCGLDWVAAYSDRVRAMMKTYARSGRGAVAWMTVPYQRDPERHEYTVAVNAAVVRAAQGLERVKVVDLAAALTPGGKYRASMTIDGKRARVRSSDGIHLTAAGARIASRLALKALGRLGVKVR